MWKYELAVRVRDSVHVHMLCDVRWADERWECVRNNGDHDWFEIASISSGTLKQIQFAVRLTSRAIDNCTRFTKFPRAIGGWMHKTKPSMSYTWGQLRTWSNRLGADKRENQQIGQPQIRHPEDISSKTVALQNHHTGIRGPDGGRCHEEKKKKIFLVTRKNWII